MQREPQISCREESKNGRRTNTPAAKRSHAGQFKGKLHCYSSPFTVFFLFVTRAFFRKEVLCQSGSHGETAHHRQWNRPIFERPEVGFRSFPSCSMRTDRRAPWEILKTNQTISITNRDIDRYSIVHSPLWARKNMVDSLRESADNRRTNRLGSFPVIRCKCYRSSIAMAGTECPCVAIFPSLANDTEGRSGLFYRSTESPVFRRKIPGLLKEQFEPHKTATYRLPYDVIQF